MLWITSILVASLQHDSSTRPEARRLGGFTLVVGAEWDLRDAGLEFFYNITSLEIL